MSADIQRNDARGSSATAATDPLFDTGDLGNLAKGRISTVIIASEWHFKPGGVMEVEKRFAEKRDRMRADGYIQWRDQDHHFLLFSERHLVPLLEELHQITRAIIVQEGGDREPDSEDDNDDDEGDTYSDLSTEFQSKLIAKVTNYELFRHTRPPNPDNDEEFYPDIVKNFDYRDIWSYPPEILMDKILKLAIVQELEAMTDSKIVKSPSQSKVYIGSDRNGSVDLVIVKLENIAKYSLTHTSFDHIFYTEEVESCKFIIKAFPEIKKKFLETTLLERVIFPKYLSERLTVRACLWNTAKVTYIPFKIAKHTPAVASPGTQAAATKPWAGFVWKLRGTPGDDPVKYFPSGYAKEIKRQEDEEGQPEDKAASSAHVDIEGWVANATTTADPSQGLNGGGWGGIVETPHNSLARLAMASEPDANSNVNTSTERLKDFIHQETRTKPDKPLTPVECSSTPAESETNLLDGQLSLQVGIDEHGVLQSSLLDSALDAELINSDWDALRHNASEGALIDVSSSPTRSPNLKIFDMADSSNAWGTRQFTALEPPASSSLWSLGQPQLPSEELEGLMTTVSPSMADLAFNSGNDLSNLIDSSYSPRLSGSSRPTLMSLNNRQRLPSPQSLGLSESETLRENRLQLPRRQHEDETSTRVFHKTMNQKASPSNKEVSKLRTVARPQESFLKDVEGMFGALMTQVRGFRGEVKAHIDFGKILLGNLPVKIVSKEQNIKPYDEPFIIRHLCPPPEMNVRIGDGPELFFTDILTTLEADTTFLSNLKNREGARLWSENCSEWKVTYEFMCEEIRTENLFTIEIDSETFDTHIVVLRKFGEIYVHGTMRHWDLKLTVDGIEDEEEIRNSLPGYNNLATEIQRNLYIPPGNERPNHSFKLPKQITDEFEIYHLKIRKTRTFNSLDGSSKLHITEVDKSCGHKLSVKNQEIVVYIFPEEKKDHNMERNSEEVSSYSEEKKDLSMETNWQEVSITSVPMNNLLQQNMKLELGEEVQWTIQDLAVKNVSNSFIKPACTMLVQMDGVGFYNDGQDLKT
ncbi:e7493fd6-28ec-4b73-84a5-0dc9c15078a9 [Sclerotinia trifoliorum]|uniref:E7493fd6-28ec-4b73-84a5-0dc9c15078a9 n=1 Tax=Sclerotinia trifoliorum TaxID=28548 RepID=A0A8H2VS92_9HELO|nr:e7493fd6-28ec-4b73-84a5-0dc9c15078a9 [Sclerotinia trifoliorum]